MGQRYSEISDKHAAFIAAQKIFFVGSAAEHGTINISPKGMDSFRLLDKNRIAWLNVTGSGNETAAHIEQQPRMTVMFCAFEGSPMILRLYGKARAIHRKDAEWQSLAGLFPPLPGARQIFDLHVELVQTSCGMAVPYFSYTGPRDQLRDWAEKKGDSGIRQYWQEKNQTSLDGYPTGVVAKNG